MIKTPDTKHKSEAKEEFREKHPSREEMIKLNRRRLQGDDEARQEMIVRNIRLVFTMVLKSRKQTDPDFMDWVAAGQEGLTKAVDRYDHNLGAFSTYACTWIKQVMSREHSNNHRTIRLPIHHQGLLRNLIRIRDLLEKELKRRPTIEELSEELGIPVKRLNQLFSEVPSTVSLDKPIGEDQKADLHDYTPNRAVARPDTVVSAIDESGEALHWVHELRGYLEKTCSVRDKLIFFARYGLFGESKGETLQVVGDRFGITRERVRQICERIFRRRAKTSRRITNEKELESTIELLQLVLETKFSYTGRMCTEIMEVIGEVNGHSVPAVSRN